MFGHEVSPVVKNKVYIIACFKIVESALLIFKMTKGSFRFDYFFLNYYFIDKILNGKISR